MKVLILNYEFPPVGGGAGRALWHLCQGLAEQGVDVRVIASDGPSAKTFDLGRVRVRTVATHRRSPHDAGWFAVAEFLFRALPVLRAALREEKPDLVHYFFSVPTGLLSLFAGRNRPYIVSLRGGDVPRFNPGVFELASAVLEPINRRIWRHASAVVANSRALGEAAQAIEQGLRWDMVPNGVDSAAFCPVRSPRADGPCRLLSVNRLIELKGVHILLLAMTRLSSDTKLDIAGAGPEEQRLRGLAITLGISDRVRFLGAISHELLPDVYRRADIFVLSSLSEAMPHVVAEAMASGLPVVATNAGGTSELIRDERNGLLVPPGDADALAAALVRLQSSPDRRQAIGQFNREDALARLSWGAAARGYRAIYERCLRERRDR